MANGKKASLWLSIASAIIGLLGGYFGQPQISGLANMVESQVVDTSIYPFN